MLPRDLKPEQFNTYGSGARKLAIDNIGTFRKLPLSFLPSLLRELIEYDVKFPAERRNLQNELTKIASLSAEQLQNWFSGFRRIELSQELEHTNWVQAPARFVEKLSEHLWATRQLDLFREAATSYASRLLNAAPPEQPPIPRLGITIVGAGVSSTPNALFSKLRKHGAYFSAVKPENGLRMLLDAAASRARAHPVPYGHWYIDGANGAGPDPSFTRVTYDSLKLARNILLQRMQAQIDRPGMGPETLRTELAQMSPADIGLREQEDATLTHFKLKVLTEGSGTQIFSTTFVQWSAREALLRAQPLTLIARFTPRQRQRPMNQLLAPSIENIELDATGSLVDANMGAYYNWLNQQRLTGADRSAFLAWFEDHNIAVAIGPSIPRGTESSKPMDLSQILAWIT